MLMVVMGVAGSGKTMIGQRLAEASGATFYDADDYHSAAAVAKMQAGQALTDRDRKPWLERLAKLIAEIGRSHSPALLACSALKESYRARLRKAAEAEGMEIVFVYLRVSRQIALSRLKQRRGHFMPVSLVDSQFATLEKPKDAIEVNANSRPELLVEEIRRALEERQKPARTNS